MQKPQAWLGHLFCVLCVTAWGTSFIVSKNLMALLSPAQLMWLRFVLAWVLLWPFCPRWHFRWRDEGAFLLLALVANTLYFLAENTALTYTQTSNVSILVATAPIFSALLLRFSGEIEALSRRELSGFGIAFLGVVLVVLNGALVLRVHPLGDLLALAAALLWALYGLLARRALGRFDSFLVTRKLMFYGILTSLPLLLAEDAPLPLAALLTPGRIASLLYLSLVCSALCYLLWNDAIRRLGALTTSLYVYAVPLVTMLAAALFLRERITPMGLLGIALILGGMLLSVGRRPERKHHED